MNLDLSLPQSWAELTQEQLYYLYQQLAQELTAEEVMVKCLMKWTGFTIVARDDESHYLIRQGRQTFRIAYLQIACAALFLEWVTELPKEPVHLEEINGYRAVAVDFDKVPFEKFLFCDNLWQGYLEMKAPALLTQMAEVLYDSDGIQLDAAQQVSIFYWFASLKASFARRFKHFLKPVSADKQDGGGFVTPDIAAKLQEAYDAQIRALTGGDITKETVVLKSNTIRALTELDAKAKDAEEYRKAVKK